ncbi:DUF1302 domain-containing protein [uncultured Abyssibacter sp.]|uniref:DUF1302 domain-containing protein n=1 Tax=uncultured Abyssibacter sp. TaxID=2320202 RepID=UPI0032B1E8D6
MKMYSCNLLRLAVLGAATVPFHASAATLDIGGMEARIDTTLSAGVSFRMQDPDESLIGISNGGTSRSANGDDGTYGYEKGDVVSAAAKVTVDLDLAFNRNWGIFTRASAFYNPEASDAGELDERLAANESRARGEAELGERGHERLDNSVDLLDAFLYGSFSLGDQYISMNLGNQVVSWGESTFIRNGINILNPIDVSKIRLPGSEIKEALTPIPMLFVQTSITDNLSMEAVWQFDWEQVEIDPRGSFFSTNDAASDDGDKIFLSYGRRLDDNTRPLGVGGDAHAWIPRTANVAPEDETSQAGVAFRYFAESLNSTEFGLYYVNYHSRTPNISAVRGQASNIGNTAEGGLNPNPPPLCMDDAVTDPSTCRASYFVEYDEDISLWGLSMNTNGPWGTAVQGEVSYRPNAPVQLSGGDVVPAALVDGMYLGTYAAGEVVSGYDEIETWQIQTTITKAFGPSFGAGQWIVLGEIGYTRQDLEDKPYSGAGAALPTCRNNPVLVIAVANGSCQEDLGGGFQTKSSWGYRLVTRLDYSNVFASVNISPRLVFFHDVNGVSSTFTEDNQVISAGVQFSYLQRWQADIAYTVFTGGEVYAGTDPYAPGDMTPIGTTATGDPSQSASFATRANDSADRDFLGVSVSYAF